MGVAEQRRCEHVILCGPPGAGKLTVARVLAERYGLRVLDNHLSVDPALRLFDFGTREFADLVELIRVALLQTAARAALDVVSTFVYAHLVDDDHLAALSAASADAGAHVTLVQLAPSTEALEERVQAASRLGTTKITDPHVLRRLLVEYDLRTPARSVDLMIDNTALSAEDAARLIADHVGLVPRRAEDAGATDQGRVTRRDG
jgi:AAA domain-containing protein